MGLEESRRATLVEPLQEPELAPQDLKQAPKEPKQAPLRHLLWPVKSKIRAVSKQGYVVIVRRRTGKATRS